MTTADTEQLLAGLGGMTIQGGAFPLATQAQFASPIGLGFGGAGGSSTISYAMPTQQYAQPTAAPAGDLGGINPMYLLVIGGVLILAMLVMSGGKHHGRRH
jgi:hypothetical protein